MNGDVLLLSEAIPTGLTTGQVVFLAPHTGQPPVKKTNKAVVVAITGRSALLDREKTGIQVSHCDRDGIQVTEDFRTNYTPLPSTQGIMDRSQQRQRYQLN